MHASGREERTYTYKDIVAVRSDVLNKQRDARVRFYKDMLIYDYPNIAST